MPHKHALALISLLFGLSFAVEGIEEAPSLSMPLACTIGVDCFIQNYVDNDTSAHYGDYRCGFLS